MIAVLAVVCVAVPAFLAVRVLRLALVARRALATSSHRRLDALLAIDASRDGLRGRLATVGAAVAEVERRRGPLRSALGGLALQRAAVGEALAPLRVVRRTLRGR